jgi:sterol desaturase/sphingolipid hydroxylase (fatty acid hydroxylase superfamily)
MNAVHSVHRKNPNPGPWTGLAMYPVEHLLYFGVMAIRFVVPLDRWLGRLFHRGKDIFGIPWQPQLY